MRKRGLFTRAYEEDSVYVGKLHFCYGGFVVA